MVPNVRLIDLYEISVVNYCEISLLFYVHLPDVVIAKTNGTVNFKKALGDQPVVYSTHKTVFCSPRGRLYSGRFCPGFVTSDSNRLLFAVH